MRKQIALYIYNENLLRKDQPLLVGLSGGADSVALLCVLQELGYQLHALHCNFHLRGNESDRDELFVTKLCRRRSIPLSIKHFCTREYAQEHHTSIEMAARDLRYEWFRAEIKGTGAQGIAIAHHRDDRQRPCFSTSSEAPDCGDWQECRATGMASSVHCCV